MKILIADDSETSRKIWKHMLAGLGHEVFEAVDGNMAFEEFQKHRPRVILSDWQMPGMNGPDLCAKIREGKDANYTYFILITGDKESQENYQQAMDKEVDDFFTKSVKAEELRNRLRVAERILGLTERIEVLESFVPICAYCKKIRRDDGMYEPVEKFIQKRSTNRSQMQFSHGICPDCMTKHATK